MRKFTLRNKEDDTWVQILRKNGYPESAVETAIPKLRAMDRKLREALLRWNETGELPEWEIEGFTVSGLVQYKGMHEIGAFLMMDWLLRSPEEAKYALAEPITKISISEDSMNKVLQAEETDRFIEDTESYQKIE